MVVCLLTGGLWFASDLTRALARRGDRAPQPEIGRALAGLTRGEPVAAVAAKSTKTCFVEGSERAATRPPARVTAHAV